MKAEAYIAALPMYDWPERRAEVDAEWIAIRDGLRASDIPAPDFITRRNADMPAVPGGIRDGMGNVMAPDPATLPPDGLDLHTLWRHPWLLYAQTCYGPMEYGLAQHVTVVAKPDYSDVEGGRGSSYSSALVMRRNDKPDVDARIEKTAPADGKALIDVASLVNKRFAFNEKHSMSGFLALESNLAELGRDMAIFSSLIESGAHRQSLRLVASGDADLAAIDARSWALAQRYSPEVTAKLIVVGWTSQRPGLPFITANRLSHFFT